MRLAGVIVALTMVVAGPVSHAAAADVAGIASTLVSVGPGVSESSQRQVVRSTDGFVYTIALPATPVTAGEHYWIALLGTGDGRLVFHDDPQGLCRSETTPSGLTLDALPSTWTTGSEYTDCPVSAYASAG